MIGPHKYLNLANLLAAADVYDTNFQQAIIYREAAILNVGDQGVKLWDKKNRVGVGLSVYQLPMLIGVDLVLIPVWVYF